MFQANPLKIQEPYFLLKIKVSSKDKRKKIKCHLLQFLFGALRFRRQKSNWPMLLVFQISGKNH